MSQIEPVRAYAATEKSGSLQPFEFTPEALAPEHVEIAVDYCGICHSDLSVLDEEWGASRFPLVPGHEIVGRVVALGAQAKRLQVGDVVGVGWFASSCMACGECLDGDQHLCGQTQGTIMGRHGGFAQRVQCHWAWAVPLPADVSPAAAGPLFCGGITVFNPLVQFGIRPTDRVGVVGVGGLGHMALQFLAKWGCEVTAFSSSEAKADEARRLGAHRVVSSRDKGDLKALARSLDFILVTVNVDLDWSAYLAALKPHGRLHFVGAVLEPLNVRAFNLIGGQKSISGSPVGAPATMAKMLEFCARHRIAPWVEEFGMSEVNDALDHLRAGKARYRIVLKNDFS